jgi:hypothetical protein
MARFPAGGCTLARVAVVGHSHWRGGSEESWPPLYDRADKWPSVGDTWTPDHAAGAVWICLRSGMHCGSVMRSYPDADAARAADARRPARCSPSCQGRHYVCWCDPSGLHIEAGCHDRQPVPASRAAAFREAGYTVDGRRKRKRWATRTPPAGQETRVTTKPKPKRTETAAMTEPTEPLDDDTAQQIIAAERRAGRHLAKIGLNRRAALAHREVADLRSNNADAETVELAEKVAQTLTDLALADLDADEQ